MDKKNDNNNNNFFNKNPLLLFIVFAIIIVVIFRSLSPAVSEVNNLTNAGTNQVMAYTYSDIKKLAEEGKLAYVAIGQKIIRAKLKDGEIITVQRVPGDNTLVEILDKYKVPYGAINDSSWLSELIFGWIIPIFIFFAIWMFLASRMQKGMGGVLGFGSAKGLIKSEKPNVKFDDVAGNEEAKEEVKEIVDFLKNSRQIYRTWGQNSKRCFTCRASGDR